MKTIPMVWTLVIGEILTSVIEGNPHEQYAVSIQWTTAGRCVTVGHIAREYTTFFYDTKEVYCVKLQEEARKGVRSFQMYRRILRHKLKIIVLLLCPVANLDHSYKFIMFSLFKKVILH